MCPVEEFFETLKLKEWGIVFLGNNKARKVQDMVSIRLKMYDIWEMVLQDMKYVSKIEKFFVNWYVWSYGFVYQDWTRYYKDFKANICSS